MKPLDDIMKRFEEIAAQEKPIRLINAYRGIPIAYDSSIVTINQGYVALKAHPYQATCMALEGKTHVQSDLLPEVYRAKAVAVDVLKSQAILTEFTGAGTTVGHRMNVRVQPREPIDAEIYDGEHRIPGKLADISPGGLGVFTFATYIYGDLTFQKGIKVFIDFRLPTSEPMIRCQGRITSMVHQPGTFLHRLGVQIIANSTTDPLLHQYVAVRQEEILDELKRIYKSMYQEKDLRS